MGLTQAQTKYVLEMMQGQNRNSITMVKANKKQATETLKIMKEQTNYFVCGSDPVKNSK